ncbi:helix-turn-helix transcriptional regulator [Sphingomonas sp. OTU376]|uniref:helix-turn-helix transcriptional regulator n=1 Tax=Sphingomonas sp. OTU376 TaxID=3043863 RepID=UPI00313C4551
MDDARPHGPPRYLKTPDAALHVGLSPRTLEKHRYCGTGPDYHKLGGRVLYTLEALDAWLQQGLHKPTATAIMKIAPVWHGDGPVRR